MNNFPIKSSNFSEEFITDVSEIIENNENLITLVISFIFDEEFFDKDNKYDEHKIRLLVRIFQSIYNNIVKYNNLKALLIVFNYNNEIDKMILMPNEIDSLILKILNESDSLIGFGLFQYSFSEEFGESLSIHLNKSKIKFLLLQPPLKNNSFRFIDRLFQIVKNNDNLFCVIFSGFKLSENKINDKGKFKNNAGKIFKILSNFFDFY